MGSARRNLLALGAFAVLMAGGIVVGRWASSRSMRLDPAVAAEVPVASPDRLRLVAIGDVGEGNATQRQVRDAIARYCEAHGCDMAVLLGDNLYQRGMETPDDPRMDEIIGDMYGAWPFPTYMVLGNHDYNHALDRQRAAWQVAWANRTDGFEMPSAPPPCGASTPPRCSSRARSPRRRGSPTPCGRAARAGGSPSPTTPT